MSQSQIRLVTYRDALDAEHERRNEALAWFARAELARKRLELAARLGWLCAVGVAVLATIALLWK